MAFVDIYRGDKVLRVSESSFENQFKPMGYRKLKKRPDMSVQYEDDSEAEINAEDEVESIPISEMNQRQLKAYAAKHGIDISGASSIKDARRMIQKHIQESKM